MVKALVVNKYPAEVRLKRAELRQQKRQLKHQERIDYINLGLNAADKTAGHLVNFGRVMVSNPLTGTILAAVMLEQLPKVNLLSPAASGILQGFVIAGYGIEKSSEAAAKIIDAIIPF